MQQADVAMRTVQAHYMQYDEPGRLRTAWGHVEYVRASSHRLGVGRKG